MSECVCFSTECDYSFYNTLQSAFIKFGVQIEKSDFSDIVNLDCYIKSEDFEKFENEINEKFSGKIVLKQNGNKYFSFSITN